MYLEDVRSGGSFKKLTFRDKDFFQNIAAETTETIEYLTHKSEDEADYLDEVSTYLENIALVVPEDKKPVLNEIQTKLKEINNLREGF
jgi:glutamate synthase domain-containing protein 3